MSIASATDQRDPSPSRLAFIESRAPSARQNAGVSSTNAAPSGGVLRDETSHQAFCEGRHRYGSDFSRALRRSLPQTEVPRDNARDWPALGAEAPRSNEKSLFKFKARFRALDLRPPREERCRNDSVREEKSREAEVTARAGEAQLVMLNRDFVVTSPVRENLLVTIALMKKGCAQEAGVLTGKFTAFSSFLHFSLGRDALRVKHEQNAGGSSTISESLSVEYFARRFQAHDVVTEMEVEYFSSNWKKVDYICTLYGQRVGVSVTRAMCYPDPAEFSPEIAHHLLCKKLYGLVVAREGVSARHCFWKCILHVWCETRRTAEIVKGVYSGVRSELQVGEDVILVLTVADGVRARPIFYEHALEST